MGDRRSFSGRPVSARPDVNPLFPLIHAAVEMVASWGAWLAQLVEHVTIDLGVVCLSPTLGVEMT